MPQYNAKMTLNELVYSVIPNLNTAERLVCNTLDSLIESAENPLDVFKRTEQRQAFNLELHRIRMNIKHLLDRYRADVDEIMRKNGGVDGPVIEPDALEADAIQSAIDIYQHVRAFRRGEQRHPIPRR